MNKNVLIIYTGGTIGMKKTEKGYAPVSGFLGDAISAMEDMKSDKAPKWDLHEMSPLLDSSDMSVKEWNKIVSCWTLITDCPVKRISCQKWNHH